MQFAERIVPIVCLTLAGCGLGSSVAERFLVPRSEWLAEPSDLGLPFEEVELRTGAETTVHGWFVPAAGNDGRTVLLCHGNAANISFYHPYYSFLHEAGWNVLLHDYRGYGRSRGALDVGALFTDTEVMLDHLLARPDVDPHKIVLFGVSLGSIVALRTAARRAEVAGVLVENASSPGEALGKAVGSFAAWLVEALALPGGMEPADNAAEIERPMLFLCGAWDPDLLAHLRAFDAAARPAGCWVLPMTRHAPNPLLVHDGEYQDAVVRFFVAAIAGRSPRIEAEVITHERGVLRVQVAARDQDRTPPLPVEVCIVDEQGNATFVDRWLHAAEETWQIPFDGSVRSVSAWAYHRVEGQPESATWQRRPGPLAAAAEVRSTLQSVAAIVAESQKPLPGARSFLETLASFESQAPLPPLLETELVPAYLTIGRVLAASELPADREAAVVMLRRCIAAAPKVPGLHYWPDARYVAGFADGADVEAARNLLGELSR